MKNIIEQSLGTTRHKNLYFKGKIPSAWEFEGYHIKLQEYVNQHIAPIKETYTINNLGYNSTFDYDEQLLKQNNILCLGDSNTFGLLLKKELTWVSHLDKLLPDTNVLNLGLPGAGADTVTRICANTIDALKDKVQAVFVIWPPYLRREFASIKFQSMVYKTPNNDETIPYPEYWDFIDWKSNSYNFHKNKILLSSICKANNILYEELEINYDDPDIKEDMIKSYGQEEYTTIGFDTHHAVANYFYKKLRSNS
jgi:hypothetical protein